MCFDIAGCSACRMNVFRLLYICRMMRCSGYCAIAMLTVIGRLFLRDEPDASFELCGSMLTLACAFAVLTGGLSMCYSLERRLRSTQQLQTPQWCQDLLQAVQSDMVWGKQPANHATTRMMPRSSPRNRIR